MEHWNGLVLTAAAAAAAGLLLALGADARVEAESGYSKGQTYSGALRYLRVDLGYEVVEKDPEAAYLMFRYLVDNPDVAPPKLPAISAPVIPAVTNN